MHFESVLGTSFETWLSHRAEPQPYLSTVDNLARQSVFTRATSLIAAALDGAISDVLAAPLPPWLAELVTLWHLRCADVLTFNYDTLVECAFDTVDFCDWRTGSHFAWGSLLNYNPTGPAGASWGETQGTGAPVRSFRLWKLHGSTNWFWAPGDASGASARRTMLPGRFGAGSALSPDAYHWMAPGRERMLVPPSALKSPYYANPVTRETWTSGFQALSQADVITLIGYSLPLSDLTTAGMLSEAFHAGRLREVRVVDVAPSPVVARLRAMVPKDVEVAAVAGDAPVPEYVRRLMAQAAEDVSGRLLRSECDDSALLVVTWGDLGTSAPQGRTAPIVRLERSLDHGEVRLMATELTTFDGATAAWADAPTPVSVGQLRRELVDARRVTVHLENTSTEWVVVDFGERSARVGHGNGDWIQLIPAGSPPGVGGTRPARPAES